jgi:hypothetical protein
LKEFFRKEEKKLQKEIEKHLGDIINVNEYLRKREKI